MSTVQLDHVSKQFGPVTAVDDFTLDVADGEFIVIVGPSGCGKSTVLRIIAGLEPQTAGDVFLAGQRVNDQPPRARNVAMVFQNYALYPHMNVYQNLAFGLVLHGVPRAEIDRRVNQAARILDIATLLSRKPRELSGGQRQRVALGRAMVRDPQVFLLDEPLSNLDAKLRLQMRAEIAALHARAAVTTIYVTHDQTEALTMADRIVVLNEGTIQQIDQPQAIYDRPINRFVAGFIGTPGMNFLTCRVQHRDGQCVLEATDLELPLPSNWHSRLAPLAEQEILLGLRPERVRPGQPAAGRARAVVQVVEPLGSETCLTVRIGPQTAVIRVPPEPKLSVGEVIPLDIAAGRIHLFDRASEAAIWP